MNGWLLSGACRASGSLDNQGANGYFWSRSERSMDFGYRLDVNQTIILAQDYDYKSSGHALRCVQ
jgi:hypothetical protein